LNIEPQNKEPQNFEGVYFDIRYSVFDILLFEEPLRAPDEEYEKP